MLKYDQVQIQLKDAGKSEMAKALAGVRYDEGDPTCSDYIAQGRPAVEEAGGGQRPEGTPMGPVLGRHEGRVRVPQIQVGRGKDPPGSGDRHQARPRGCVWRFPISYHQQSVWRIVAWTFIIQGT